MPDSKFDLIIIGTGITGLTAAKHAVQSGLATAVMESLMFGGLVININELEPAPPGASASGSELASNLMMEVTELGATNLNETASALSHDGDLLSVTTDAGTHCARAVIVASGAKLKRLGIPGETEFEGGGVSQCADCDGPMYTDEEVVVVGGGDSALQEALVLANFCKQVHLVHRGAKFSARQHLIDAVAGRGNIHPVWNTVAEEVLGTQMVEKIRVRNTADGTTREIPSAGFFAYIGLEPVCEFMPPEIKRDSAGFLITDASLQTTMAGVYAAGAVRAGFGGMLTDAMADAQTAVTAARAALKKK